MAKLGLFGVKRKEPTGLPEVPPDWIGSKPEFYIYWALTRLGVNFIYQSAQMGGRLTLGGAVLDFYIPDLALGINIQSTYYHYSSTILQARGEMQKAQLEGMGIKMIYIQEADALRDPLYYTGEALAGREHPFM